MIEIRDLELGSERFSLRIPSADIPFGITTAVVGKNGSGKTSLLESLLGLRMHRSGFLMIEGLPSESWLAKLENKQRFGVQLQSVAYPANTLVREVIQMHSLIYACKPETKVITAFDVAAIGDRYYENLSRGEKQRVDLFVAFAHWPAIVFLDEPCTGLDAKFHERALQLVGEYCQNNDKTVLIATHDVQELRLSHGLLVIDDGLVRQTTVAAGLAGLGEYCGELLFKPDRVSLRGALDLAVRLPEFSTMRSIGENRMLTFGSGEAFKIAFESFAKTLGVPYNIRMVSHEDLLRATANEDMI